MRQLSSADLIDSYTETLFRQISEPTDAEYAIVDLGGGRQWLTSRLFIFALVLGEITGLRAIVFLEKSGLCRKTFLGVATPSVVWKTLAERYPWFQEAFVRATVPLLPPPPEDKAGTSLITGPVTTFPTSNPAQLKDIARSYVAALQRRTDPPEDEKRDHQPLKPKISGGPTWEKATWITGDLLEQLLGAKLSDDWCVEALDKPQSALVESILKRNDDFVALVDGRHKFRGLVDRKALASQAWKTRDHERTVSAGGSN